MIIFGFGANANSCIFPQSLAQDDWQETRPPVTTQIAGANGAFDFYSASSYPLGPITVRKQMQVLGTSWADVETKLDTLASATIMAGESKLWGKKRDGTTTAWAYAKCTRFAVKERAKNPKTAVPVEIEFFCREGVWYGASGTVDYETAGTKTLTNGGSGSAQIAFTFYNNSAGDITVVSVENLGTSYTWTFSGTIPASSVLVVDSANQICTVDGTGAYSNLTVGAGQSSWLTLTPGSNQVAVAVTPGTGPFLYEFAWTETD